MKKITLKDIAKASDVSVATVSYVLNHNEKQTIPQETRNRILNIANELNYIPCLTARSLVKKKSALIGIIIVTELKELLPWKKCYYTEFFMAIEHLLSQRGYHVLITQIQGENLKLDIILERGLDGAFIVDVREDVLYKFSNMLTVPIVLIDSIIDDTLFHKIIPNFENALALAKSELKDLHPFIVLDSFNNNGILEKIKSYLDVNQEDFFQMTTIDNYIKFLECNKNKKGIIFNESLAVIAEHYVSPSNLAVICSSGNSFFLHKDSKKIIFDNNTKAKIAVDILLDYIDQRYYNDKYTFIHPVLTKS
jgi:transcriptional regulator with XRE-family HTH domain